MTVEEAKIIVKKRLAGLVDKWGEIELIDRLEKDYPNAILLESKPKQYFADDMTQEEKEFSDAMCVLAKEWK